MHRENNQKGQMERYFFTSVFHSWNALNLLFLWKNYSQILSIILLLNEITGFTLVRIFAMRLLILYVPTKILSIISCFPTKKMTTNVILLIHLNMMWGLLQVRNLLKQMYRISLQIHPHDFQIIMLISTTRRYLQIFSVSNIAQ